jgi:antirestriction protein ArdC
MHKILPYLISSRLFRPCLVLRRWFWKATSSRRDSRTERNSVRANLYCGNETLHLVDDILSKIYYSPVWAKYKESKNYGVAIKLFDKEDSGPNSG